MYWSTDEKELTLNPCPPTVTHTEEVRRKGKVVTPASDDRNASSIDITETVIHIPNSTKVDLSTSTTYTDTMYPEVRAADNKENGDGTGDGMVWVLPACPPDGPSSSSLCMSFAATLLDSADWGIPDDKVSTPGPVEFDIDHAHQHDVGEQGGRYVLAYDAPEAGDTSAQTAIWDTSDADRNAMSVSPGGYERPLWFFTRAGRYEFQVHVKGHPEHTRTDSLTPVSKDRAVTSDVREYFFHVGLMADLSIAKTVAPANPSPGDDVTITITASNAGPDTATSTKVDVTLPEGLAYSSHNTATGTYDSAAGVWTIGDLAVTNDDNTDTSDDSPALTITATVAAETRGQELAVKATISATETLEIKERVQNEQTSQEEVAVVTYTVPVLDPVSGNDMATGAITVASAVHTAPMFKVTRSVAENSAAGTNVGDIIMVMDPDEGETLTYALMGTGSDNFTATAVDGGVQIQVAAGAHLDYETTLSYDLTLTVSDGVNHEGNADASVDHKIALRIDITDVVEMTAALTVTNDGPSIRDPFPPTFSVTVENAPVPVSELHYAWHEQDARMGLNPNVREGTGIPRTIEPIVTPTEPKARQYYIIFWTLDDQGQKQNVVRSNTLDVLWEGLLTLTPTTTSAPTRYPPGRRQDKTSPGRSNVPARVYL